MATASKDIASLHDRIRTFITSYLPLVLKRSAKTVKAYVAGLNSFRTYMKEQYGVDFIKLDFCHFSLENVNGWLLHLRDVKHCAAATLNLRLASIRGFLSYCSDRSSEHSSLFNAVAEITKFEDKTGPDVTEVGYEYLKPEQLRLLYSIPDTRTAKGRRDRFFMIFAFETGARLSELLNLKLKDICNDDGQIRVLIVNGKGDKSRYVPVAREAVPHLKAYISEFHDGSNPDDYLFYIMHDDVKQRMHDSTPEAFVKKYGKEAHKRDKDFPENIHVHMFRHSLATQLVRKGVPLSYIADLLGHASLDTTRIYAKNDQKDIDKAISDANADINAKLGKSKAGKKWAGKEDELLRLCGLSKN